MSLIQFITRSASVLLACAAMLPTAFANTNVSSVAALTTQVMNAKYARIGDRNMVETGYRKWLYNGVAAFDEVKRTETTIQFLPAGPGGPQIPLMLDFAKKTLFMDFQGTNAFGSIDETSSVSGFHVGLVLMQLTSADRTFDFTFAIEVKSGSNDGWILHVYKDGVLQKADALPLNSVSRNARGITVNYSGDTLAVDLVSRTCRAASLACQVTGIVPVSGREVGHIKYGRLLEGSSWGELTSITQFSGTHWREELASGAVDLIETGRTSNYVELRRSNGVKTRYPMATGSGLMTQPPGAAVNAWHTDPAVKVAHVERQWPGQLGTTFAAVTPGVSPGFQIQNKTDFPVLVTLEQAGCLYYGIVQPGQIFQRNTGAVWFTIKASMAPDLKEPTVFSCIRDPAIMVSAVVAVGMTAGSVFAAVPAMMVLAAGYGGAAATEASMLASGYSANEAAAAKIGMTALTAGAMTMGFAIKADPKAYADIAGKTLSSMGAAAAPGFGDVAYSELVLKDVTQADIDSIKGQLTQTAYVYGAYAGYPWPWKMADRVMPHYEITGGPLVRKLQDGSTLFLKQRSPLTVRRVN